MKNKPIETCEDDNCLTCQLCLEFGQMIKEGTHWEDAVRYVLAVAFSKEEETLLLTAESSYGEGFHHGVMFGIEQSQKALDNVHTHMTNKIAEDESDNDNIDELMDLMDKDDTDEIQKIIENNQ